MNKERKAPVHIMLTFGLKLARDYRSEEIVKILGKTLCRSTGEKKTL